MNNRLFAAPMLAALALAIQAAPSVGTATIVPSTHRMAFDSFHSTIEGAKGSKFIMLGSPDEDFHSIRVLGHAPLSPEGSGFFELAIRDVSKLPTNFRLYFRAAYRTKSGIDFTPIRSLLLNPTPVERINFTWGEDGERIAPGAAIHDQWARLGVEVHTESFNPNVRSLGIAMDSEHPGNAGEDLRTPGNGNGNDRELLNLLVVAGTTADHNQDRIVDRPFAEQLGGRLTFKFDRPTFLDRLTIVNVDRSGSNMRCFSNGRLLGEIPIPMGGENSVQTIGFPFDSVTRLEVTLCNGAGIAELTYLPCPEIINFDRTMTGIPTDFAPGEVVRYQLVDNHAVRITARSNNPFNAGLAVIVPRPEVAYRSVTGQRRFEENVLVISENTVDRNNDGYVDEPIAEPMGGVIVIDFNTNVRWNSASVADVNCGELSYFVAENDRGESLGVFPLAMFGENVVQTLRPNLSGVRRIRLHLGGTAALVDFSFCSEDEFPRLTHDASACPMPGHAQ